MPQGYGQDTSKWSWAIMSLFLWLMPHISMEIGEYHRALSKSTLWSSEALQATGKRAIRRAALVANLIAVVLIVGAACGIALNTKNLDNRMHSIINGLSFITGAVVIFLLSWNFPEWLEVYNYRQRRNVLSVTRSLRALKFNVMWSVLAQHFRVYFFLLPFYCGAGAAAIPISAIVGIIIGAIVDLCVYWGKSRKRLKDEKGLKLLFFMILVALVCSGALFSEGCQYINEVWGSKDDAAVIGVAVGTFLAWLLVGLLIHYLLWRITQETVEEMADGQMQQVTSYKYKNVIGQKIVEEGPGHIDSATVKAKSAAQKAKSKAKTAAKTLTKSLKNGPSPKVHFDDDIMLDVGVPINAPDRDEPQAPGAANDDKEQQLDSALESTLSNEDNVKDNVGETDAAKDGQELVVDRGNCDDFDDNAIDPTFGTLFKSKCCCFSCFCCEPSAQCCAGKDQKWKVISCGKWVCWSILSLFSIYFFVINIGATYQQDVVRLRLPSVKEILYKNMNDIEVCAYDGDGSTGSLNAASTIKTFPSKDAARAAGFLILHCGACAACSTWPNIKYEYTTRSFLAAESKKCGVKSLFGGADGVQACLERHPIQWQGECARCWTVDILCAKAHCPSTFYKAP